SRRRRHPRFSRDWSSDVCSSDLKRPTCERSYVQPNMSKIRKTFSRLRVYTVFNSEYQEGSTRSAVAAANCNGRNMPESILLLNLRISSLRFSSAMSIPIRHPAILDDLLNEFNSIATSFASGTAIKLSGLSFNIKL